MDTEFEHFLTDISHAFTGNDLEQWRARLILPFSLITKLKPIVLRTEDAVAHNFQQYRLAVEMMNMDLIDRVPITLEECPDGTWLGTFRTRMLSGPNLATAPYTSTALLHNIDGRFRMSSMLNARGHQDWTGVDEA
ncbi:hypothetical protein [uncultured Shimia sp.]|uniref:hypothetical protein n=1 Tax=uncultured Shimia sp. TaxID=573152 RepID=UPI002639A1DB|nr:hypothetical protein [uncultured Shimia sp.]